VRDDTHFGPKTLRVVRMRGDEADQRPVLVVEEVT
jgi:hypothetical protein